MQLAEGRSRAFVDVVRELGLLVFAAQGQADELETLLDGLRSFLLHKPKKTAERIRHKVGALDFLKRPTFSALHRGCVPGRAVR